MASPAAAAPPSASPKDEPLSSPHASLAGSAPRSPSSSSSPARDRSRSRSLSPLPLPAPPPSIASAPPPSVPSSRRLAVPCWNHEETLALIDAYRDKWYALRRGNLRANHWQEVSDGVNRRCTASGSSSTKTSVQCRHKVEKLRKRYRNERQKSIQRDPSHPPSSNWIYFRKMEAMERGAAASDGGSIMTTGARRLFPLQPLSSDEEEEEDEGEEEDDSQLPPHGRYPDINGNTRSLHRLMANGGSAAATSGSRGLRFTVPKAVRSKSSTRVYERPTAPSHAVKPSNPTTRLFKGYEGARPAMEEMRRKLEKRRRSKERESEAVSEMVSALRTLGDGFLRMEQRKMEMAREMEKVRMEMELKRSELILDSQRRIVDAFVKGFLGRKKAKSSSQD